MKRTSLCVLLLTSVTACADAAARLAPEALDAAVYDFAEALAAGPTRAIKWTKVSVNIGLKQLAHSILDASLAYEWLTFKSTDHGEAVAAFLEKRQPTFNGG